MEVSTGNYLVYVDGPERSDGYVTHALEWNEGKGWSRHNKDDRTWESSRGPFTGEDRDGLLKHFGLSNWKDEFPWDRILTSSPADLARARREKEQELSIERLEIFRSGDTNNLPAEDFS